jgi:hypothetical protein
MNAKSHRYANPRTLSGFKNYTERLPFQVDHINHKILASPAFQQLRNERNQKYFKPLEILLLINIGHQCKICRNQEKKSDMYI